MKSYSQSQEDLLVLKRLKKGTVLEIGANSGEYLSNSKLLIENGWTAYLIEPGKTFIDLKKLHEGNDSVHVFNFGIATENGKKTFFESGEHEKGKGDVGLVSTAVKSEMDRWLGVEFTETEVDFVTFDNFWRSTGKPKFDFISIDCEGFDWSILQQINLKEVGCKILCIEWNGIKPLKALFDKYCRKYRMREIHRNGENIIYSI